MIETIFTRARNEGRAAFIPYVMAGDPDLRTSFAVLDALARAGVDAIELGIPYGDPLADGPTIAAAGVRALAAGTGIADAFALVRSFRDTHAVPIVLFTYFNPVYQYGFERFARDARAAGASGAIVPDIPLEEGAQLGAMLATHDLDMPLLVAPSTSAERAERIAAQATGFVYVVSRLGVTGASTTPNFTPLRDQLAMLRTLTEMPLAVGFGVSRAEHVRSIAPHVDGIIVGSALIDAYAGGDAADAAHRVTIFATTLVEAAKRT